MATIAEREEAMFDAVASIAPQVDHLHVYMNDYKSLTAIKKELFTDRITFHDKPVGDLGDSGKFWGKQFPHDIYFSVDDDLIYPPDYVETTLKHLETHPIVSYHGRLMLPAPVRTYYHGLRRAYHVNSHVDDFYPVHVGGTGVMAQRANAFSYLDCKEPNMSDIWVGIYAQRNRIPIVTAPHRKGWVKLTDKIDHHKNTIWAKHHRKDKVQTRVFNSISWQLF